MKLILASNSPRRKELLTKAGYQYVTIPSNCNEDSTFSRPQDLALENACAKAMDVFKKNQDGVVIGCDTVVDLDGVVYGKPTSVADAKRMLGNLSGNTHLVHTGVCVASKSGIYLHVESTAVKFFSLTGKQIDDYVATGSALDKAGAYGIQDSGFVQQITGDYDNVVGFPTSKISGILDKLAKGDL